MHHFFLTLINGGGPLCTIQRLKAKCDAALSNFAFNFKLRRYSMAEEHHDELDRNSINVTGGGAANGGVTCGELASGSVTGGGTASGGVTGGGAASGGVTGSGAASGGVTGSGAASGDVPGGGASSGGVNVNANISNKGNNRVAGLVGLVGSGAVSAVGRVPGMLTVKWREASSSRGWGRTSASVAMPWAAADPRGERGARAEAVVGRCRFTISNPC